MSADLYLKLGCRRRGAAILQGFENATSSRNLRPRLDAVRETVVVQVIVGPSSFEPQKLDLLSRVTGIRFAAILQAESQFQVNLFRLGQSNAAVLE